MKPHRHRGGSAFRTSVARLLGVVCAFALGLVVWSAASAHEVRPAYLELREEPPGEFSVLFKTPMRGDARLALAAEFSGPVETLTPVMSHATGARPGPTESCRRWAAPSMSPTPPGLTRSARRS